MICDAWRCMKTYMQHTCTGKTVLCKWAKKASKFHSFLIKVLFEYFTSPLPHRHLFDPGSHVVQASFGLGSSCPSLFSAGITAGIITPNLILSPVKVDCSLVLRHKGSLYIQAINSLSDILKILSSSLWFLLIGIIFMDLCCFMSFFINSHILLY